jgi:hypothetical protein
MLPAGLVAQPMDAASIAAFRRLHPPAQTVATLLVGQCSCDLVRTREPDSRNDERHLRQRYARLGLSRERIIRELERHRRIGGRRAAPGEWARELAGFVAEHARNAGPTLYQLRFATGDAVAAPDTGLITRTVEGIRAQPERWLQEGPAMLVVR